MGKELLAGLPKCAFDVVDEFGWEIYFVGARRAVPSHRE
jgi:hypothetical protein